MGIHLDPGGGNPFKGVNQALVIAGSDKRGTIYGLFDISKKIGVSPWYWWADVPVSSKTELYVLPGRFIQKPPKVKYRGIFLNDEEPAFAERVKAMEKIEKAEAEKIIEEKLFLPKEIVKGK
jgi:hypothetical protein